MKIEDLLRIAFADGMRYGQARTNLNFNDQINSTEYQELIKLFKNNDYIPVVIERFLQDKGIEYAESLDFDNIKEQGIAYSSFVAACKFIVANKDKIDSLNAL